MTILLVEDNPADARLLDIFLKDSYGSDYTLTTSDNLSKGLEYLGKQQYHVIILDLSLPDSAGLDTFKRIYEEAPETPIIVLTGYEDDLTGINAVKFGAQDFLVKDKLNSKSLNRSIKYSIERSKLLKELSVNAKKLEEKTVALLREKRKLTEAQKLAQTGSWEWDLLLNTVGYSEELFRIYGQTPTNEPIPLDRFLEPVVPEDRKMMELAIEESCRTLRPFDFYYRIDKGDDGERKLHARGEVITDNTGKPIQVWGTAQDVTERLKEEELQKLVLAATKSYNSVLITDREGKIEWVNEGFTKLSGYTLEDIKNTKGEILKRGNQAVISQQKKFYEFIHKEKNPITFESKNYTKEGKEYWTITTLTPVPGKNGEVERIIAIDSDISIRKLMEEELLQANQIAEHSLMKGNKALDQLMKAKKQVEESMKVKEQFLANMSHEIRTPMNAIVGFTGLLLKTEPSPEQRQYINAIKTSGENLLVIINDILDFSKIQSGKIMIEQIELHITQVISTLTELMLPKSIEKNIKLSTKIDKNIPESLIGDPTRLNQILLNLVGNAIKFTEKGEVKISVKLLSETEDSVNLRFAVSDTGIGIPESKKSHIFDGFTQASNETTRKYGGTGLGLTIVKQLLELQGGSIAIESELGKGSVFSFDLTFKKSLEPGPATLPNNIEELKAPEISETLDILLVEDNLLNQVLAKKILKDWKWNVDVAENGLIAIAKLEEKNYNVVLMDIQLPEMDGNEATRYIRTHFPQPKCDVPIIAMTAHAIRGEAEKCYSSGMNDYISKPFDEKVLYSKILSAVRKHNQMPAGLMPPTPLPGKNGVNRSIDLNYLKNLSNGSDEFVLEMINVFLNQTPEALRKMELYLKSEDWRGLKTITHTIKPSFTFMGIKELEQVVKLTEEYAASQTNLALLPEMVSHIVQVSRKAMQELEKEKLNYIPEKKD